MGPARDGEQIGEALFNAQPGCKYVFEYTDEFMGRDTERIESSQIFDDAVSHFLIQTLFGESSEKPIPDNKNTGIIGIKILRCGGMVNTVMGRRVHEGLDPFWEFLDCFGVDEKLIEQVHRAYEEQSKRVHAEPDKRQIDDEKAGERIEPCLP